MHLYSEPDNHSYLRLFTIFFIFFYKTQNCVVNKWPFEELRSSPIPRWLYLSTTKVAKYTEKLTLLTYFKYQSSVSEILTCFCF